MIEFAFETPLTRRAFLDSEAFRDTQEAQKRHIAPASAFAIGGVYTYVRDKQLTTAGLRGSRPAQLIERLGAKPAHKRCAPADAGRKDAVFVGRMAGILL
ncbi:hypothetical protein ACFOKI_05390 [Sphingomonas qilianensis]|uniref:Uncharacterized protein n=1 Tax=Sphingomonas qilianensis TaxID=1736690 RepID=A0ABU9XUU9_9SPHN